MNLDYNLSLNRKYIQTCVNVIKLEHSKCDVVMQAGGSCKEVV